MSKFLNYLSNNELMDELLHAAIELAGSGARGRHRYHEAREELLKRLGSEEE